jgi:hypothetical protein
MSTPCHNKRGPLFLLHGLCTLVQPHDHDNRGDFCCTGLCTLGGACFLLQTYPYRSQVPCHALGPLVVVPEEHVVPERIVGDPGRLRHVRDTAAHLRLITSHDRT